MYVIDQKPNRFKKLDSQKFKEANFEERKNLQEWIDNESELIWLNQDEAVKLDGIEKYNKTIHR